MPMELAILNALAATEKGKKYWDTQTLLIKSDLFTMVK
jgi:hypothetical protein